MSIGKLGLLYGACTVALFAIDFIWLSIMNSRFYQPRLGGLLAEQPKLAVAAVFYLLYVIGVVALAVVPGIREGALVGALWRGALFGLLAYATYDLTNLATIQGWPWELAAVDMIWGTVLTGSVSVIGYFAGRLIGV
jgi:uncharacterized membrane protein